MLRPSVLAIACAFGVSASAGTVDKANNSDDLNLGSSWVGGVVPGAGDVARWTGLIIGPNTVSLGSDTNWLGIKITNPSGLVTIAAGNLLALGSGGVDLSSASTNLAFNCGLNLLGSQTWSISNNLALTVGGQVAGAGVVLSKAGGGSLFLSASNSLSGSLFVSAGKVVLNHARGLGSCSASVANGAQVYIGTAATYTNSLALSGNGEQGALRFNGGTAAWSGPITLVGSARIGAYASSGSYTLSGGITGTGNLEIWAGGASSSHIHTFTVSAPCSYSGDTLLNTYAACPVLVLSGGADRLPTNTVATMLAGIWNGQVLTATLKLNGNNQTVGGLVSGSGVFGAGGTNRVVNGSSTAATLTINSELDRFFDGAIGGAGANNSNLSLVKKGVGKQSVTDACTLAGALTVAGGTLDLQGTLTAGSVTVSNACTLLLGKGSNTVSALTLNPGSALGVNVGGPSNPDNTLLQVNGNLVLNGTLVVQELPGATASNVVTVINYTGSLLDGGLTTDSRSRWTVQVDTSVTNRVRLGLHTRLPAIEISNPIVGVTNTLQLDMEGVLRGFPLAGIWYEARTPDGKLWDFGATPPTPTWKIRLRHLRGGTNNVRVFTVVSGSVEEATGQVVLDLGKNTSVRPRPVPAEIWWGGVATDLAPDYGYAQLVDPSRPWEFVQQYQDGIFLHGILPTPGALAALANVVAPHLGRFAREGGFYMKADPNFGLSKIAGYDSDLRALAGAGVQLTFHSVDFNPGMRVWPNVIDPGWCQRWPNWTHDQLVNTNTQCWTDFVTGLHTNWPGLKLGWTWSPVWFNWGGYPALVPSGDNLTLHPVKDAAGNVVMNQFGTNAWFEFDMQEFFTKAAGTANLADSYFGFASDCPFDYFATWSNVSDRTNNQKKILAYENWLRTNNYFPTTICNYSANSATDTNQWDANFALNSLAYITLKQQLGGRTQKYLFESWYDGPYTWAPESNANSFAGLVKQGIKYLKGVVDTNGTLETLSLSVTAGSGAYKQVQLRNNGDVRCLPALVAIPGSSPGLSTRFFSTNGTELTATMQTQEGLCFTNLLQPGASTGFVAVTVASGLAAPATENASVEAFWNPQDPLGIVRDREWFSATLNPLGDWQTQDIGTGGLAGGAGWSSNVCAVIGSGADIWDVADNFRFVYMTLIGDGTISARISFQLGSDQWAKAGVMVRDGIAAGARNVFMGVTPGNGATFQTRVASGTATSSIKQGGIVAPCWVRLVRAGTSLAGYYSSEGTNWTLLGSTNVSSLPATLSFGFAVCSHNTNLASAAVFESVLVAGGNHPPVFATIPNVTNIAGSTLVVPLANYVSDLDLPSQTLTYSLVFGPTNSTLNTNTGAFSWRPLLSQSPVVTSIRVSAVDNGIPPLSATQSFWAIINSPVQPRVDAPLWTGTGFVFIVYGDAGPDYSILMSTNLVNWLGLWTNISATPPLRFDDTGATNQDRRFYRVLLGP